MYVFVYSYSFHLFDVSYAAVFVVSRGAQIKPYCFFSFFFLAVVASSGFSTWVCCTGGIPYRLVVRFVSFGWGRKNKRGGC